ncbi:MAG: CotH kinase family protein [Verrucomicrobiota bacterium]
MGAQREDGARVEPALEVKPVRGFYTSPVIATVTGPPDLEYFYTTNGSVPSPDSGQRWRGTTPIATTTVLRVAAFRKGLQVGPVATQTYLFPRQVLRQTGAGFPASWGNTNGEPVAAAYSMAPELVADPQPDKLIEAALRAIPSVSLVLEMKDLFDPARGIYANPLESGIPWERSASVEWMDPGTGRGAQMDCGLRIQGGWNRRPEESPKHSFRLVFHQRYGPARCTFPLFAEPGAAHFETLILRAGCNNTWLHWSGEERRRGEYLRDQWMRDTLRAMGHRSARGAFVHLYLNGLYWGLYNLAERPSAPFMAAAYGGKAKQYDSRNGNHILDGDDVAWRRLMDHVHADPDESKFPQLEQMLDVRQFADFILANLYGANADWDGSSNWYAGRRRQPPGPFQFFVWDGERTLESADANILTADSEESPMRLFQKLRRLAAFRTVFATEAIRHLSSSGALGPAAAAERFRKLAQAIELPIVAESARWGAYRRDVHPYKTGPYEHYTRERHWRPEVDRLLTEYFPARTERLRQQLAAAGLLGED